MSGGATPEAFVVRVPATSANLGPGFDCLGLALTLHNTLEVQPQAHGQAEVTVTGEGEGLLPRTADNVALRAMQLLATTIGSSLPPLYLRMHNAIPLGRGLGSSAAAIVGGLFAAAHLLGVSDDPDTLLPLALALEGHPDNVVAALYGGLTLGLVAGKTIVVRRFTMREDLYAVMLIPDQFASTRESRAVLPRLIDREDAIFNLGRCALLVSDLTQGRLDSLAVAMDDRLHQPHRAQAFPYLPDTIDAALRAGALGAALSGAGSSVLALAREQPERVARAMAEVAARHRVPVTTRILRPEPRGVHCLA